MSNLYEQLSREQLQQIDKLCDAFEAARRAGQRPRIEEYLSRVATESRPLLCRELVGLELANAVGQPESPDAYLRRFPEYRDVLTDPSGGPSAPRQAPRDAQNSPAPVVKQQIILPRACVELQSQLTNLGILEEEEVQHELQTSLQTAPPQTTVQFTQNLVHAGLLTSYQAKIIGAGKMRGLVLGNYVILEELGRGGMGAVFRAKHRRMQRVVALKLISSSAVKSPEAVKRFHREVQAAAQLTHPNIVTAFDASEAEGRHFLVMEYVPGQDLSAYVRQHGVCSAPQAVNLVAQAARGLAYAHAKGIVHRDIKPGNLLLDEHGVVKVLDMGLARIDNASNRRDDLTSTGQVMGTVDYMSPEQAVSARQADHRADIYSLGLTLWYLLTGRPAFAGESLTEKLLAHQQQPAPSLCAANPQVSPALEAVFQRMVAKEPAARFQTMNEVLAALVECGAAPPEFGQSLGGFVSQPPLVQGMPVGVPASPGAAMQVQSPPLVAPRPVPAPRETPTVSYGEASEITSRMDLPAVTPHPERGRAIGRPKTSWVGRLQAAVASQLARLPISPRWRQPALVAAALGGAAIFLAGIMLFIETDEGVIQIVIQDEGISVQVDGQGATISGAKEQEIEVGPGEHGLRVRYGELDFQTDKFVLTEGGVVRLEVRLVPGRVQVFNGQTVVGESTLPEASVAAANTPWHGWPADAPPPAVAPFDEAAARAHQQAWADYLGVPVEWENSIGMKFVLIPPGEFLMGSAEDEKAAAISASTDEFWQEWIQSEVRLQKVVISQPFFLGVSEVTQAQFQKVAGTRPSHFSADGSGTDESAGLGTGLLPVESVSWNDAAMYCTRLSNSEELSPSYVHSGDAVSTITGIGYRLPTEAEWEFACRAGKQTTFWFGDEVDQLGSTAWFGSTSGGSPHPVGVLNANPFGLFDMHGNVWEWTQDPWQQREELNGAESAAIDRTLKGGDWHNLAVHCRAASRSRINQLAKGYDIGFRTVLSVDAVRIAIKDQETRWPVDAPPPAIAPFDEAAARAHQHAWADYLGVPVEWENSIGMKFVLIPPGEFQMGSTPEEVNSMLELVPNEEILRECIRSESPQHQVVLSQPFYLGVYETTQAQFEQVMGRNPAYFSATGGGHEVVLGLNTADHPVEQVSWDDAISFCAKLSQLEEVSGGDAPVAQEGMRTPGFRYRLPWEAEWEFSCRAGTIAPTFCSPEESSVAQVAWFNTNSAGRTHPVGQLGSNAFGLYDVYGNVWEWCQDFFDAQAYAGRAGGLVVDPRGPATSDVHVLRGGHWNRPYREMCRSAFRSRFESAGFGPYGGFRVALDVDDVRQAQQETAPHQPTAPPVATAPFDESVARSHQQAWADYLGVPVEWENSVGMQFVLVPPGEFEMGSTDVQIDEGLAVPGLGSEWLDYIRSERPLHRVRLTQPIYVGAYEVTQSQYEQVVGVNPSRCTRDWLEEDVERLAGLAPGFDLGAFPVEQVSWYDAVQFCAKLSEQEGLQPFELAAVDAAGQGAAGGGFGGGGFAGGGFGGAAGGPVQGEVFGAVAPDSPVISGYRLPTEAQWEFACRAGTSFRYWSGDDVAALDSAGWFTGNSSGRPHAGGELAANSFGLFDVHGNVGEWVLDNWSADYYGQFPGQTAVDPRGAPLADGLRVIRGASWFNHAAGGRCGSRYASDPNQSNPYVGFRVVLPVAVVQRAQEAAEAAAAAVPEDAQLPAHEWPAGTPPPADGQFARGARAHQEAWATHLGVPAEWENSVGMKFVLIPPGAFKMGALPRSLDETLRAAGDNQGLRDRIQSEHPWHRTVLTRPFYLAVGETTQGQYVQVMGANPAAFATSGEFAPLVADVDTNELPIESVRWLDAVDFCTKLGEREELPPFYSRKGEDADVLGGDGYRLPTEAEWEFACRAGTVTRYWSGNTGDDLLQVAWMKLNSQDRTHPTCTLPANGFGLCDMHGNVWEWVQDLWTIDYYAQFAQQMAIDPTGPSHAGTVRSIRGGSWEGDSLVMRSSHRAGFEQTEFGPRVGFRVALSVAAVKREVTAQ